MPTFLLQHISDGKAWGASLEQQWTSFVRFSVSKHCKRIEAQMSRKLLLPHEFGRWRIVMDKSELTRATATEMADYIVRLVADSAVMTVNEARGLIGLSKLDTPDADRLRQPRGAPDPRPSRRRGASDKDED